jgi:restriction system protein
MSVRNDSMTTTRNCLPGSQFVRFFGPVLDALRELGGVGRPEEVVRRIADDLHLSDQEREEMVPSGGVTRLRNRVAWARFYLAREGLVDTPRPGMWRLTQRRRATRLTHDEARLIHGKWVRHFQEQHRAIPALRRGKAPSSTRSVAP